MRILVVNCGSSSIKYQLFDMPGARVLAKGLVQRIGEASAELEQHTEKGGVTRSEPVSDHRVGLEKVAELLTRGENAPIQDISEIGAVGHRVVHGGEHFTETVRVDDEVMAAIEAHFDLAPLHNPPNLLGIRAARELLPAVPQVAVFDTAFHQSIPRHAYLYALPRELHEKGRIRRYGFHGTSHRYVAARAAELLGKPARETNLITCHLGNGSSITAIRRGRSVDTSMGLTPLEGLVMGTRSGDIDPAIIFHLERVQKLTVDEIDRLLNKRSGLLGLSGQSNDVRELLRLQDEGNPDAALALEVFCYRIKKYIGAYLAVIGRLDAVVFTAGIGENAHFVRERSCAGLDQLGIAVDPEKNQAADTGERDVSRDGTAVRILVIPTDEERMIARETARALSRSRVTMVLGAREHLPIPIEVSAHHVHLQEEHVARLFGPGHELTPRAELSQPGQFACVESVDLVGPRGTVERVRVLGPCRKKTQVEISRTEEFKLGIDAPVRRNQRDLHGHLADRTRLGCRRSIAEQDTPPITRWSHLQ